MLKENQINFDDLISEITERKALNNLTEEENNRNIERIKLLEKQLDLYKKENDLLNEKIKNTPVQIVNRVVDRNQLMTEQYHEEERLKRESEEKRNQGYSDQTYYEMAKNMAFTPEENIPKLIMRVIGLIFLLAIIVVMFIYKPALLALFFPYFVYVFFRNIYKN